MALPEILPATRLSSIEFYQRRIGEYAEANGELGERAARRWLAKNDLFFLLVYLLRRADINRDWLFDRCREVQAATYGMIALWARGHYKSTIKTFGLSVLDILNDPEVTIGIFSDTNKVAKPFLLQLMREFEDNEPLKLLFDDVLWAKPRTQAPKWSELDGIIVKRKTNPKESTVEAFGLIDGQPQGRHFRRLRFDDVVTEETVGTPEAIAKVTKRMQLADNLGAEGATKDYSGTRYHQFDTWADMMERGIPAREHPATDNGKEDGKPVLLTDQALADKRRDQGPYVFNCQMLLNPVADKLQGFKEEWLRYWPGDVYSNLNLYILVDPASRKRPGSDYTSMWVIGVGSDRNVYVCDMLRDRLNLTERTTKLIELHRTWSDHGTILGVGYEEYGLQSDIEHIEDAQGRENYRFDITPLGGQLSKEARIKKLVPLFEQGRIYLLTVCVKQDYLGNAVDLTRAFVREEYLAFPLLKHDDMLDGLARIRDPEMNLKAPSKKLKTWNALEEAKRRLRGNPTDTSWMGR